MNRKQLAVLAFLERAELRDGDSWYRSDYRLAAQIATLASEGHPDPYTQAFVTTYGKHPSKVVGWWRDREKLLRIAEQGNCATPLLLANQAQELLERPAIIPDYDPTVSPVLPNPGVEPKPAKAPARATTSSGGRAGDSRKGSAA